MTSRVQFVGTSPFPPSPSSFKQDFKYGDSKTKDKDISEFQQHLQKIVKLSFLERPTFFLQAVDSKNYKNIALGLFCLTIWDKTDRIYWQFESLSSRLHDCFKDERFWQVACRLFDTGQFKIPSHVVHRSAAGARILRTFYDELTKRKLEQVGKSPLTFQFIAKKNYPKENLLRLIEKTSQPRYDSWFFSEILTPCLLSDKKIELKEIQELLAKNFWHDNLSIAQVESQLQKVETLKKLDANILNNRYFADTLCFACFTFPALSVRVLKLLSDQILSSENRQTLLAATLRELPLKKEDQNDSTIRKLLAQGAQLEYIDIEWLIEHQRVHTLNFLRDEKAIPLKRSLYEDLLDSVVKRTIPPLFQTAEKSVEILEFFKTVGCKFTFEHLKKAVENHSVDNVQWLVKNVEVNIRQQQKLKRLAVQSGNIEMAKIFCKSEVLVEEFLSQKPWGTSLQYYIFNTLQNVYYHSSMEEAADLSRLFIETLKDNKEVTTACKKAEADFREWAPYIVRHQEKQMFAELQGTYRLKKIPNMQDDIKLGKYYAEAVKNIKNGKVRKADDIDFSKLPKGAETQSDALRKFLELAATVHRQKQRDRKANEAEKFAELRRKPYKTEIRGLYRNSEACVLQLCNLPVSGSRVNLDGYSIYYEEFLLAVVRYTIKNGCFTWHHGRIDVEQAWPLLEDVFFKLLNFKLDEKNERNLDEFYCLCVELLWLFALTTPTSRGSGTYGLMILGYLHDIRDINPPVAKRGIQLDCAHLSFPWNLHLKNFFKHLESKSLDLFAKI